MKILQYEILFIYIIIIIINYSLEIEINYSGKLQKSSYKVLEKVECSSNNIKTVNMCLYIHTYQLLKKIIFNLFYLQKYIILKIFAYAALHPLYIYDQKDQQNIRFYCIYWFTSSLFVWYTISKMRSLIFSWIYDLICILFTFIIHKFKKIYKTFIHIHIYTKWFILNSCNHFFFIYWFFMSLGVFHVFICE